MVQNVTLETTKFESVNKYIFATEDFLTSTILHMRLVESSLNDVLHRASWFNTIPAWQTRSFFYQNIAFPEF